LLAQKWGLPATLSTAIRCHHTVDEVEEMQDLVAIINMADYLAHMSGLTNNSPEGAVKIDPTADKLLELPEQQLKVVSEVMMQEVTRAQDAFLAQKAA
jgi:HD-like signal output (HDOD) protein